MVTPPARKSAAQLLLFEPWPVVERISARARRARVEVRPDGAVVLTIPRGLPRATARRFLDDSRGWIERTRVRLARARAATPLPWEGGRDRAGLRELAAALGRRLLDAEAARLGVRYRTLRVRDPRTRWGSCGPGGDIMLSLRLVMAPREVFRYVAIHELCHLRWHGHGPRFWGLVARQMPEFGQARAWLRANGARLHAVALD